MVVTPIPWGQNGWAHLAAVSVCHDREVIGYEFALRSRAKEAERTVETAPLERFGTLGAVGAPVLRSDNTLIFQSRRFRQGCRDCHLQQEFITPYAPEQIGIIERFFRSLKEECVWQHVFRTFRLRNASFETGCGATPKSARIRRWTIGALPNIGRNMRGLLRTEFSRAYFDDIPMPAHFIAIIPPRMSATMTGKGVS